MSMVQIRNVPEDVHRRLKARAALAGTSLSEYLLRELERLARRPTRDEILARLSEARRPALDPPPADVLAEARGERG